MKVEYSSNNSGGSWWLEDKDWINLEKAGWTVIWGGYRFCGSRLSKNLNNPLDKPECDLGEKCHGHPIADSYQELIDNNIRYLGGLAKEASKEFHSPKDAVREFEEITGQSTTDEGCGCCGAPHSFSWENGYASGEDIADLMYDNEYSQLSRMELLEKLSQKENDE